MCCLKSIKSWFPNFTILHVLACGFLPSLFFLLFLIGDGVTVTDGKLGVVPILIMMLLTVSGYVLAWKRQKKRWVGDDRRWSDNGDIPVNLQAVFQGWQMALLFSLPFVLPGVLLMSLQKLVGLSENDSLSYFLPNFLRFISN